MEIEGRRIAVFNTESGFAALDAVCPHSGGPLGDAIVADSCVVCPLHNWRIDFRTGEVVSGGQGKVGVFDVVEIDGELFLALEVTAQMAA